MAHTLPAGRRLTCRACASSECGSESRSGCRTLRDTLILGPRGLVLLGSGEGTGSTSVVFDTPALLLPADLGLGSRWSSEGKAGSLGYEVDGRVVGANGFEGELGGFDDCLDVETQLVFTQTGRPDDRSTFIDRYCAGVGLVESREFGASGEMVRRTRSAVAAPLAPREETSSDPANWRLTHFGRLRLTGSRP